MHVILLCFITNIDTDGKFKQQQVNLYNVAKWNVNDNYFKISQIQIIMVIIQVHIIRDLLDFTDFSVYFKYCYAMAVS